MSKPHWLIPSQPVETYQEYLEQYQGVSPILKAQAMGADAVITELKKSGLRGRGGAGFPAAAKWDTVRKDRCPTHAVVCNAAEGEPGTFKDRYMIRKNPYPLLEGVRIAARVIGTQTIRIGIKESFKREVERLRQALGELKALGLFEGVDIQIILGPESYLFGEEKGLLQVVDGIGPFPREAHYPPYEWGLQPTITSPNPALVSNAETFSHVPSIIHYGGDSFHQIGTPDTPGTIILTLCGDIQKPGIYEVPTGTTLNWAVMNLAGGPLPGRKLKAILSGVSVPVILPAQFETPLDFGSMRKIGSGLGSAGFIIMDDQTNIPRVAQAAARFLFVESCGQCPSCKMELNLASTTLDQLIDQAVQGSLTVELKNQLLERVKYGVMSAPQGNRCYLPTGAKVVVSSLMQAFHDEFDQLVQNFSNPRYLIPKIIDYDESKHVFVYDEKQWLKTPDWSYEYSHA